MKYIEAKEQLKKALSEQQTISTRKLRGILQSLNFSLSKPIESVEIDYLKNEIKKLKRDNNNLRKGIEKRNKQLKNETSN